MSADFPVVSGSFQTKIGSGKFDTFVTKVNSADTGLVYSTFICVTVDEYARGIAVDSDGNAHVTGRTSSTSFPTTPGALQTQHRGQKNFYALKLNPAGAALTYSTMMGGSVTAQAGRDRARSGRNPSRLPALLRRPIFRLLATLCKKPCSAIKAERSRD